MKRLMMILLVLCVSACHRSEHGDKGATGKSSNTYKVTQKSYPTNLYFTSTMEPIVSMVVPTSYGGVITQKHFKYGDHVTKDQLLFVIQSSALASKYRQEITSYLQDKNQYETALVSFRNGKELYKAQVIDRQTFEEKRTNLQNAMLTYINQEQSLRHFMKPLPKSAQFDYSQLFLKNTAFVKHILEKPLSHITIRSPMEGVALLPKGDNKAGAALTIGDSVKQDQNLTRIGDMHGLVLRFTVSEDKVNRIKVGQAVTVSSPALPGMQFNGRVEAISSQATPGGSTASFPAVAVIHHLTPENVRKMRVGISAQLQMQLPNPPAIYVPIRAVHVRNGMEQVQLVEGGKKRWVSVGTGKTTYNQVEVTNGLKVGQIIALPKQETP